MKRPKTKNKIDLGYFKTLTFQNKDKAPENPNLYVEGDCRAGSYDLDLTL